MANKNDLKKLTGEFKVWKGKRTKFGEVIPVAHDEIPTIEEKIEKYLATGEEPVFGEVVGRREFTTYDVIVTVPGLKVELPSFPGFEFFVTQTVGFVAEDGTAKIESGFSVYSVESGHVIFTNYKCNTIAAAIEAADERAVHACKIAVKKSGIDLQEAMRIAIEDGKKNLE